MADPIVYTNPINGNTITESQVLRHMNTIFGGGITIGSKIYNNLGDLNKLINRLDIEKDAKAGTNPVPAGTPSYYPVINKLFNNVHDGSAWSTKLHEIENAIFLDKRFGSAPEKVSWFTKPGQTYSVLPDNIKTGYHDSGYSPSEVINGINLIITPGSYIDPAPREKVFVKYFPESENTITLTPNIMSSLGFPEGMTISSTLNQAPDYTLNCNMNIDIIRHFTLDETRNVSFQHIGGGIDYFAGNNVKNRAIVISGVDDVKKYTICKELGDLLQCVYTMIHNMTNDNFLNSCIFTADKVVAARARTMKLTACVQDVSKKLSKNIHCVYFYQPIQSEEEANNISKGINFDLCNKNNNEIVFNVNRVLARNVLFLGTMEVNIPARNDHPMRDFLRDIITQIGNATTYAQTMLADPTLSPDQYKKISIQCMANTVVNKKGVVPSSTKRLFVPWDTPMPAGLSDTILLNSPGSLSNILQRLVRQRGGVRPKGVLNSLSTRRPTASIKIPLKPYTQTLSSRPTGRVIISRQSGDPVTPSHRYIQTVHDPLLPTRKRKPYYEISTLLKEVYNSIKIALPDSSDIDCEDYVYFLYNYFIYIGETPLDPNYLYALLTDQHFMSGSVTLNDFKRHYDSFAMTGSPVYSEEDVLPQIDNYSLLSPFQEPVEGLGKMGGRRDKTSKRRKYYRRNRRSMKNRT
uniref:Uncharacterized protein n=1 Tax=viral metagenome TaxID=1070528 RepID=A0A6C0K593_9ZZZZ